MMDLYGLLVENLVGGFWMSVFLMIVIYIVIFAFGGVSFFSALLFSLTFLLAMSIGYGSPLITILLVSGSFIFFIMQLIGFMERGGGQ